jgi:ankyrin repeat protein
MKLAAILALSTVGLACSCGSTQDKATPTPSTVAGTQTGDQVAPIPEDDLAQLLVKSATIYNRPAKKATKAKPYFVQVNFGNPTKDEIASLSGDVVIYDGGGNELSRSPVKLKMETDTISFRDRLLPYTAGDGKALIDKPWSPHTTFEIKSGTYYPDAHDYKDIGHLFALVTRQDNQKLDEMMHKDPSLMKVADPITTATMIQVAAMCNNVGVLDYLIGHGVDFNSRNELGRPVLMAISTGADEAALDLIRRGASLEHTEDEPPPLELAAGFCREEVIDELVKRGCDPNDLPVERVNPLEAAAHNGNRRAALALIKHGAKVNFMDKAHTPPLFHAVMMNHIEMVQLLLDNGADINVHAMGGGYTALMTAAGCADGRMVEFLLSKGADIKAKDDKGKTAIDVAKEAKNAFALEVLQSAGKV